MTLNKLHLENFKKYVCYDIEFGEGLIGIIGKNGSGKSTIFEAILFALYGEFKNRGEKELVRNSNATTKDVVVVELVFEFDSCEYRVVREFRGKALSANAKFYKNEELTTSGAREVTNAIIALTKMSKDAFMHTLFASQKELTSLSTLKNEDRKKMIRRLLGLEKIDFIEKELVEKSRELKRSISAFDEVLLCEEELSAKETQIKEIKVLRESLVKDIKVKTLELEALKKVELEFKTALEVFAKTREAKQKAFNEVKLAKNTLDVQTQALNKLEIEIKELSNKAQELEKLSSVKQEYLVLQEQLKLQVNAKEIYLRKEGLKKEQTELREQYIKAKGDIDTLEKECSVYGELLNQQELKNKSVTLLRENKEQLHKNERTIDTKLSAEQRVVSDTNIKIQKIQNLGSSSACPTCTRPLLEEYDNVLSILHNTIVELQQGKIEKFISELQIVRTDLQNLQIQLSKEEQELQVLSNKIALIQSKQSDLLKANEYFENVKHRGLSNKKELSKLENSIYEPNIHKKVQDDLNSIKQSYEYVLSLETELKRQGQLTQELKSLGLKLKETKQILVKREEEFGHILYDEVQHQTKEKEFVELQKSKDEKQATVHTLNLNMAKHEGEEKAIQSSLDDNAIQLGKVQTKKEDLKDYEKIKLSLVEFKTKLNAKVAPRISDTASKMYSQITKGKYQHIEVNNDFDFFIYDDGKKYPIERFSGGEIDLANLVLRIAISKTLTELSGASSIGFLAFDEVFGSQDEVRRMEILEAFHTLKEQYRQIFLISHEMEIKEMFERVVEL